MTKRKSLGVTLIESLVVLAILGLLIALVVPAVQRARESARRAQCRGRLACLGLAMHNYHDNYKTFPPGIVAQNFGPTDPEICQFVALSPTCDQPMFSRVSALTLILPFMEEKGVYQAYNMQLACCASENATATGATIQTFICPSNMRRRNETRWPYYLANTAPGPTDYVLSMGGVGLFECQNPFMIFTGTGILWRTPSIMKRSLGVFNVNRGQRIDDIKDGAAYTILMGESAGGPELSVGLVGSSIPDGAQRMNAASTNDFCENAWSQGYISSRQHGASQGFGSVFAATAWNAWYDNMGVLTDPAGGANWFPYPINETQLRYNRPTWAASSRPTTNVIGLNGAALPASLGSVQGFRSHHPRIANFLLCDGSVKSLSEQIDARLLVGYGSIAGREQVVPPQ